MKYYRLDFFSFITHARSDLELRLHFAGVGRVYTHTHTPLCFFPSAFRAVSAVAVQRGVHMIPVWILGGLFVFFAHLHGVVYLGYLDGR
jgi:hypothetical protein